MTKEIKKNKISLEVNFEGMECPQINLELRLIIKKIKVGEIIEVVTDNEDALMNMPKWCLKNKQELFFSNVKDGLYYFYIKKTQ